MKSQGPTLPRQFVFSNNERKYMASACEHVEESYDVFEMLRPVQRMVTLAGQAVNRPALFVAFCQIRVLANNQTALSVEAVAGENDRGVTKAFVRALAQAMEAEDQEGSDV